MLNQTSTNPFLFVCGVPRSGTTLLQRMLNAHPKLAVANDSHFIPRALELTRANLVDDAIAGRNISICEDLQNKTFNYHRFYRLGISKEQFQQIANNSDNYRQLVSGIYDQFARNDGKRLGGEKTPDYVRRLTLLHSLFPSAKLVHIVRDGRNVALSLLQWAKPNKGPGRIALWEKSPIAVCALWWKWLVDAGTKQSNSISPETFRAVQYESLIRSPRETMENLCCFLEIDFEEWMLQFNKDKVVPNSGLSAKNAWLPPTQGLRDWRRDLADDDVALFQELAGESLVKHGYELHSTNVSSKVSKLAAQCKYWWSENFLSKHSPDPSTKPTYQTAK